MTFKTTYNLTIDYASKTSNTKGKLNEPDRFPAIDQFCVRSCLYMEEAILTEFEAIGVELQDGALGKCEFKTVWEHWME